MSQKLHDTLSTVAPGRPVLDSTVRIEMGTAQEEAVPWPCLGTGLSRNPPIALLTGYQPAPSFGKKRLETLISNPKQACCDFYHPSSVTIV